MKTYKPNHIKWSVTEFFNGNELVFKSSNASYEKRFYTIPYARKIIDTFKLPVTHFITTFYERKGDTYQEYANETVQN